MKPNILFLTIDSLRSDRFYGEKKSAYTPNFDKLVQNGTLFTNTYSSIPSTKRATSCILTSLHPFKTGNSDDNFLKIPSSIQNHLSTLKKNNYHVFATIPEILSSIGLFSEIENPDETYDNFHGRLSNKLDDKILQTLKKFKSNTPWIYYIHLLDLIKPTISDDKFNQPKFGNDQYDRIISNIDHLIGKLLDEIDLDNTVIIITADHSAYLPKFNYGKKDFSFESSSTLRFIWKLGLKTPSTLQFFWSKLYNYYKIKSFKKITREINYDVLSTYDKRLFLNLIGHTRDIHDDNLVIPFLMSGYASKHLISDFSIRQIDIFPTIFEIIGINLFQNIDGISLNPILNGKNFKSSVCYFENLPTKENNWKKIIGIKYNEYKFSREKEDCTKIQLYDLEQDPLEEKNIVSDEPELVSKMEKILENILENDNSQQTISDSSFNELERKKVEDELRKLGYL